MQHSSDEMSPGPPSKLRPASTKPRSTDSSTSSRPPPAAAPTPTEPHDTRPTARTAAGTVHTRLRAADRRRNVPPLRCSRWQTVTVPSGDRTSPVTVTISAGAGTVRLTVATAGDEEEGLMQEQHPAAAAEAQPDAGMEVAQLHRVLGAGTVPSCLHPCRCATRRWPGAASTTESTCRATTTPRDTCSRSTSPRRWRSAECRISRRGNSFILEAAAGTQRASRAWKLAVSPRDLPGESADDDREDVGASDALTATGARSHGRPGRFTGRCSDANRRRTVAAPSPARPPCIAVAGSLGALSDRRHAPDVAATRQLRGEHAPHQFHVDRKRCSDGVGILTQAM